MKVIGRITRKVHPPTPFDKPTTALGSDANSIRGRKREEEAHLCRRVDWLREMHTGQWLRNRKTPKNQTTNNLALLVSGFVNAVCRTVTDLVRIAPIPVSDLNIPFTDLS